MGETMDLKMRISARGAQAERALQRIGSRIRRIGTAAVVMGRAARMAFRGMANAARMAARGMRGLRNLTVGVGLAAVLALGLVTNASIKQEDAERALAAALEAHGNATTSLMPVMLRYASAQQKLTRYGDEEILSQMAYARNLGVTAEKLQRATTAAMGLAAKYRIDLRTSMMLVGRASQGQTQMLTRYGIVLDDTMSAHEKFNEILRLGGGAFELAKRDAETLGGRLVQLKNAFGDLLEVKLGKSGLGILIGEITESLVKLKEGGAVQRMFDAVAGKLMGVWDYGRAVFAYAQGVLDSLKAKGGEAWGQAFREAFLGGGEIMATMFLSGLAAGGNVFTGIGKLIAGALLEDILKLPGFGFARERMAREAKFGEYVDLPKGASTAELQRHEKELYDQQKIIAGMSMKGQLGLITGKRPEMLAAGVQDLIEDVPNIMKDAAAQIRVIKARSVQNIENIVGYKGPSVSGFAAGYRNEREERLHTEDLAPEARLRRRPSGGVYVGGVRRSRQAREGGIHVGGVPWQQRPASGITINNLTMRSPSWKAAQNEVVSLAARHHAAFAPAGT